MLTEYISSNSCKCCWGALILALVALVRCNVDVHTCNDGKLSAVICFAKAWAYNFPRADNPASPPIRPITLNSLSPCCKQTKRVQNK